MTPQDRTVAREALLRGILAIDQVADIQKECEATGRPFAKVAVDRGLLGSEDVASILGPKPKEESRLYKGLLIATLGILLVLIVAGALHGAFRMRKDQQIAEESLQRMAEAERQARDARMAYQLQQAVLKEADEKKGLQKARSLMAFAEERLRDAPGEPQLHLQLVEATVQFNNWLREHPDDADVLVERSRTWELRRNYDEALRDIDRAIELKKDLAPKLNARLQELRLNASRPKK